MSLPPAIEVRTWMSGCRFEGQLTCILGEVLRQLRVVAKAEVLRACRVSSFVLTLPISPDHDDRRGASKVSQLHGIQYHAGSDTVTTKTAFKQSSHFV